MKRRDASHKCQDEFANLLTARLGETPFLFDDREPAFFQYVARGDVVLGHARIWRSRRDFRRQLRQCGGRDTLAPVALPEKVADFQCALVFKLCHVTGHL